MKPENMWAYGLLEDVRRNALGKAEGKKPTVQIYAVLQKMVELDRIAGKEGFLALEDTVKDWKSEIADLSFLQTGIDYVTDGASLDFIIEALTAEYWTKNPQGMEALIFYICIRGIVEIQNNMYSIYELELLLKSVLAEEYRAEYEKYKEQIGVVQKQVTPREKLEQTYLKMSTKGTILRNTLEEMIDQASDSTIKEAIWKMNNEYQTELILVVEGLSNRCRERLFSCMSKILTDKICEEIAYMGPVRQVDVENAFVCLIDGIKDISEKSDK